MQIFTVKLELTWRNVLCKALRDPAMMARQINGDYLALMPRHYWQLQYMQLRATVPA